VKLRSLAAALLVTSISSVALADTCELLTQARFQHFESAMNVADTASAAASTAALPYSSATIYTTAIPNLKTYWSSYVNIYNPASSGVYTTFSGAPILPVYRGSAMPFLVNQFGNEMHSRIGHARYWATINAWYNRASSPFTNAKAPAVAALNAIDALHAVVEGINHDATACLKEMTW
jgi:hypothetical protein